MTVMQMRRKRGLLNISLQQPIQAPGEPRIVNGRECSKKVPCLTHPTQVRQDAPFHRQGRSHFDARSVLIVREHGKMARTPLAAFFNIPKRVIDLPTVLLHHGGELVEQIGRIMRPRRGFGMILHRKHGGFASDNAFQAIVV